MTQDMAVGPPTRANDPTETPATTLALSRDGSADGRPFAARVLDAAVTLAESGVHVFPVRPGGKVPLGSCPTCRGEKCTGPEQCGHDLCHGHKDATADVTRTRARWHAHPGANIGVATGASGLAVVDLDGPAGVAQWRDLVAEHGAPRTLTVSTPSGGCHLWYRARPDRPLRNSAKELAGSVDTRGVGGYAVAPPSTRHDGVYQWLPVSGVDGLPVVPEWILDRLDPPRPDRPSTGIRPTVTASTAYLRRAVAGELDKVLQATPGHRNHSLNRAAFCLGQLVGAGVLDRVLVVTALRQAAEQIGLGERESDRSITSGINAGVQQPRTGISR